MTLVALVLALSPFTGSLPHPGPVGTAPPATTDPERSDGPDGTEPDGTEPDEPEPDDPKGLRPGTPEEQDLVEAGAAFNRGVDAFKEERYEDALRHFSRAQELAPHPDTLFNLGLTQQLVGDHLDAWHSFEELLAQSTDDKERQELLAARSVSREHVASLRVSVQPRRKVCFDGAPMPRVDGESQVLTTPGEHLLEVDRESRHLVLDGGETRMLELQLPRVEPPAPPRRRLRALGGLAIGGAGAAAGLGLAAGFVEDQRLGWGLGGGAAAAGTLALTTTIIALVVHRRARRWTPPPPHDPCPVPR